MFLWSHMCTTLLMLAYSSNCHHKTALVVLLLMQYYFILVTEKRVPRWVCEDSLHWWKTRDSLFQRQDKGEGQGWECHIRQDLLTRALPRWVCEDSLHWWRQETRYSNRRFRVEDKDGNVILDKTCWQELYLDGSVKTVYTDGRQETKVLQGKVFGAPTP